MVTEVRTIIGDCSVTTGVAAFITTASLPASRAIGGAERLGGEGEAERMSTPSRTTSSWARRLATSGFRPPVSLRMISIFLPATSSPCSAM